MLLTNGLVFLVKKRTYRELHGNNKEEKTKNLITSPDTTKGKVIRMQLNISLMNLEAQQLVMVV